MSGAPTLTCFIAAAKSCRPRLAVDVIVKDLVGNFDGLIVVIVVGGERLIILSWFILVLILALPLRAEEQVFTALPLRWHAWQGMLVLVLPAVVLAAAIVTVNNLEPGVFEFTLARRRRAGQHRSGLTSIVLHGD